MIPFFAQGYNDSKKFQGLSGMVSYRMKEELESSQGPLVDFHLSLDW
jgi:hypothetical protein